jgi:hypothetical protein
MRNTLSIALPLIVLFSTAVLAADCKIKQIKIFAPQHKSVALANGGQALPTSDLIVFKSALRVNTDGAPTSYHPDDPRGNTKAINNVVNGISISKPGTALSYGNKIAAFEKFRDAGWVVPNGFKINWRNVIATVKKDGREIPCVLSSGPYKGYFGSLTTLSNGLPEGARGECETANQIDQQAIAGLVLPGGSNPLREFGAKFGDLVLALNPVTHNFIAAVVADGGPPENLGEGSVAMNMSLLGKTALPKNYDEAKHLDTGTTRMVVAIVPASRSFEPALPFSQPNITARVESWAKSHGYQTTQGLADTLAACGNKL